MTRVVACLAALLCCFPAAAQSTYDVFGLWLTPDRDGVVSIQPCSAGLCGYLVGVTGFKPDGSPPVDVHGRSLCRYPIIPSGQQNSDGGWDSYITDPHTGSSHTITLRRDGPYQLRMRGYVGITLFGRTLYWPRFTGTLASDCHYRG